MNKQRVTNEQAEALICDIQEEPDCEGCPFSGDETCFAMLPETEDVALDLLDARYERDEAIEMLREYRSVFNGLKMVYEGSAVSKIAHQALEKSRRYAK
jgi:hypothetical protein